MSHLPMGCRHCQQWVCAPRSSAFCQPGQWTTPLRQGPSRSVCPSLGRDRSLGLPGSRPIPPLQQHQYMTPDTHRPFTAITRVCREGPRERSPESSARAAQGPVLTCATLTFVDNSAAKKKPVPSSAEQSLPAPERSPPLSHTRFAGGTVAPCLSCKGERWFGGGPVVALPLPHLCTPLPATRCWSTHLPALLQTGCSLFSHCSGASAA